jgi:tetratricopeptide (TPR) repeat protein
VIGRRASQLLYVEGYKVLFRRTGWVHHIYYCQISSRWFAIQRKGLPDKCNKCRRSPGRTNCSVGQLNARFRSVGNTSSHFVRWGVGLASLHIFTTMATTGTSQGDAMRVEGVNALNRALIFGFGKNGKFTDAAVHFTNAGNAYRRANEWQAAGDCFVRASEAHEELNEISNTIGMLIEAAHCYRHVNPTDCVGAYRKAIDLSKVQGNYIAASWYCKSMAEVFEQDNDDEMALTAFEEADKLYEKVGNKDYDCAVKVARYSAEFGDLTRAASIFEAIAKEGVLSRSCSARNYCFYSLLCYLAMGDHLHVRRKIAQCKNVDFTFGSSREGQFIEAILQVLPGMHSYYVLLCFHSTLCCPWCAKYSNSSCAFIRPARSLACRSSPPPAPSITAFLRWTTGRPTCCCEPSAAWPSRWACT